jgi:hypothetical protein
MTGPDLHRDLEAIGRRLSPRLGTAHDAVVVRATASAGGRARRPRPGRLGGAVATLAVTAGFGTLLAVGVATRPAPGTPADRGPSVAMATTTPGAPASSDVPGAGEATPVPGGGAVATEPAATTATPTPAGPATATAPPGGPVLPGSPGQGQQPAAAPSAAATPGGTPVPEQTPGPSPAAATAPPRFAAGATAPAGARVVLSERDSGRTITVHPGDVVEVDLSSPQDTSRWTVPSSTDQTVVRPISGSARNDGSARAVFTTPGKSGSADLQASRVPACATATPRCLPPQRIDFRVTIVVA